ncbi:hypothetical protein OIE68_31935 [Nocardia vinacea]|uniref:DUF3558 domain-containing protein n=1 Tax=Nocardia vinacea TaxID=96468 RepID=A0ABZ1Z3Z2_9NOCA|nr:hypothetical protein OIE68_31935 [Nocardia vinacea]
MPALSGESAESDSSSDPDPVTPQSLVRRTDSGNRLLRVITAGFMIAGVVVFVFTGVTAWVRTADQPALYTVDGLGNPCAMIDLSLFERVAGPAKQTPVSGKVDIAPPVALYCDNVELDHAMVNLKVEVSDRRTETTDLRPEYDRARTLVLGRSGTDIVTRTVPGIGEDAYLSASVEDSGIAMHGCDAGLIQRNVSVEIRFDLFRSPEISAYDLADLCEQQLRTAAGRLR